MNREVHVRICGGGRVRFPPATRHAGICESRGVRFPPATRPGVRAAAPRPERVRPAGRAHRHRRRRPHRQGPRQAHLRGTPGALPVKLNTKELREELDALDWRKVPVQHETRDKGHGRRERRTIQVTDAPEHIRKRFPRARQVALTERHVTRTVRVRKGKRWVRKQVKTAVAVFIITSLSAREAAPEHLAGYALLLAILDLKNPS
jgi:hypothetical protein